MPRSCFAPSGNAERLLGNTLTNPQWTGADGIVGHYDDAPLCIPQKAEQTLGVPRKRHSPCRGIVLNGYNQFSSGDIRLSPVNRDSMVTKWNESEKNIAKSVIRI
jgi:hypothetical protein